MSFAKSAAVWPWRHRPPGRKTIRIPFRVSRGNQVYYPADVIAFYRRAALLSRLVDQIRPKVKQRGFGVGGFAWLVPQFGDTIRKAFAAVVARRSVSHFGHVPELLRASSRPQE
mgnify:CR=1 FL=1